MSQYINRKKIRTSLIRYFKAIAKSQKQIQSIQQKLITHVRFNPIILYKKISHPNTKMSVKTLKLYFQQSICINQQQYIKLYQIKHNLLNKQQISLQTFLQTLLPYTPHCLRDVNETIQRQLQTQHTDIGVQQIYYNLIKTETQNLFIIRLLQQDVNMKWSQIQQFMAQDILQRGRKIDITIKEDTDIIYIRKWMELWTQVDQYEVLNLMRFFYSSSQQNILRIYQSNIAIHLKCTCANHQINIKNGINKSQRNQNQNRNNNLLSHHKHQSKSKPKNSKFDQLKPKIDQKLDSINQNYYSDYNRSKSKSKIRFQTQIQPAIKSTHAKFMPSQSDSQQTDYYNDKNKNKSKQIIYKNNIVKQIQTSNFKNYTQEQLQKIFLKYVATLLESQKYIDFNRMILRPYKKQVQQLLHDLLSKKKPYTKIQKILLYTERITKIKKQRFEELVQKMGGSKIQNKVVFSIFFNQSLSIKAKSSKAKLNSLSKQQKKSLSPNQIIKTVSLVLNKFIETKLKLIKISQQLSSHTNQILDLILESNQTSNNKLHLSQAQYKSNCNKKCKNNRSNKKQPQDRIINLQILQQYLLSKIKKQQSSLNLSAIRKKDLIILMNHLGDGKQIYNGSLCKLFTNQIMFNSLR